MSSKVCLNNPLRLRIDVKIEGDIVAVEDIDGFLERVDKGFSEREQGKLNFKISCSKDDKFMCPIFRSDNLKEKTKEILCWIIGCYGCLEIQKVQKVEE